MWNNRDDINHFEQQIVRTEHRVPFQPNISILPKWTGPYTQDSKVLGLIPISKSH